MKIEFTVRLPVDVRSVPFVRGMCRRALEHLDVDGRTIEETTLALTEACANAVQHASAEQGGGAVYEVSVAIDPEACRISVLDEGAGLADAPDDAPAPDLDGDIGHGLLLMRALVDQLDFTQDPDGRHRVTLEKRLVPPAPTLRLVTPG